MLSKDELLESIHFWIPRIVIHPDRFSCVRSFQINQLHSRIASRKPHAFQSHLSQCDKCPNMTHSINTENSPSSLFGTSNEQYVPVLIFPLWLAVPIEATSSKFRLYLNRTQHNSLFFLSTISLTLSTAFFALSSQHVSQRYADEHIHYARDSTLPVGQTNG